MDRILRAAVRRALVEEFGDYGYGTSYAGVTPWTYGYGGSSKGTKSSYGAPGGSLYGIFVTPFVNAAKVVVSELGQTAVRVGGLITTVVESVLDALLPRFRADFAGVQKKQDRMIAAIRKKYQKSYEAVDEAWDHPDIALFSFLWDPTLWLGYQAITAAPEHTLNVFETLVQGSDALALYLRDIRNRLFGGGSSSTAQPSPQRSSPTAHEGTTRLACLIGLEEAEAPKRKKTPGEQLADILTSEQFKRSISALPIVKEMRADAESIENASDADLRASMSKVLDARNLQDLAAASGGTWQVPQDYQKLSPEERASVDEVVVDQAKASMSAFYRASLEQQVKGLIGMGISEESPRIRSLRNTISTLAG